MKIFLPKARNAAEAIVEPTLSQKLKNQSQLPRKSAAPTFW
jgi:hypothetical protein